MVVVAPWLTLYPSMIVTLLRVGRAKEGAVSGRQRNLLNRIRTVHIL